MPISPAYQPDPQFVSLGEGFFDPVAPADFPQTILRYRNGRAAESVGLGELSDADWIAHFGRFSPLPGNIDPPVAMRYHGHQFRNYNPQIGDGRGFLFAQLRDDKGRLLDLGTKGSGQTPFSRDGDGRLTLKGAVREILATEMLEALGVHTSKTFSVIETGESLWRGDEPSPTRSAVLVRLSHSHIRFGTFQRIAFEDDAAKMHQVVRYALEALYDQQSGENDAAALLNLSVERMADLAASYMVAGFVHGVLNTDNMNITGESFDYGPWRFAPTWDPGFTAAYFDHGGLYAFARQPEAIHWNLGQLAVALRLISEAPPLIAALERFGPLYQQALVRRFCWRLGVVPQGMETDRTLVGAAEALMMQGGLGIDAFFFAWMGDATPECPADLQGTEGEALWAAFGAVKAGYAPARARTHAYWQGDAPQSMLIGEVEDIWAAIAERDDWSPLSAKVDAVRAMGEALRG